MLFALSEAVEGRTILRCLIGCVWSLIPAMIKELQEKKLQEKHNNSGE